MVLAPASSYTYLWPEIIVALTGVLLRCISAGAPILLRPRFDVETTLADIEQKKATVFPGVPTMWIALAQVPDLEKRDSSSLRFAGSGGAPGRAMFDRGSLNH